MIFEYGQYMVDVDVARTIQFYEQAEFVSNGCSCDGCRNYEHAVEVLPQPVRSFFAELGIDMKKICECYVNCTNQDGSLLYGGFYHLCGTLSGGRSAWVQNGPDSAYWEKGRTFSVDQNFHVSFSASLDLLEKNFPLPALQLEISANIPWVLEKENPYTG
jgi:hypothetical protein